MGACLSMKSILLFLLFASASASEWQDKMEERLARLEDGLSPLHLSSTKVSFDAARTEFGIISIVGQVIDGYNNLRQDRYACCMNPANGTFTAETDGTYRFYIQVFANS